MANSFSEQLLLAARTYPNMCTAFAQFLPGVDYIGLHIQAPEIMMEFAGSVQFGKDPKGLLFYNSISGVRKAYYSIHYYQGGPFITARVDFYAVGQNKLKHFARFLAKVDTGDHLPPQSAGLGEGEWKRFIAATCQSDIHKVSVSPRVRIRFPPIKKQVFFHVEGNVDDPQEIDTTGLFIFFDKANLENVPEPHTRSVVDYTPDRIVFRLMNKPENVVGLFLPAERLGISNLHGRPPMADWQDFTGSSDLELEHAHDSGAE